MSEPALGSGAALKCVYFAVMALDPTGKGRARWTQQWKGALNAFDITFDGRLSATATGTRYTENLTVPLPAHDTSGAVR